MTSGVGFKSATVTASRMVLHTAEVATDSRKVLRCAQDDRSLKMRTANCGFLVAALLGMTIREGE